MEIRSTIKTEQLYFQKTDPISETKYLKGRKDMVNGRVQEEMGIHILKFRGGEAGTSRCGNVLGILYIK